MWFGFEHYINDRYGRVHGLKVGYNLMASSISNTKSVRRVLNEIDDVNNDFHSLRTLIRPTEKVNEYSFVLFPNDGAMSHLPLIGEFIIPSLYPADPPVIHLFTRTGRYNVDVYSSYVGNPNHSTLCFDILRSAAQGGTWDPSYTISCLFASLMQALVCVNVPQEYGGDKPEFVSMEKMHNIKRAARVTYEKNKQRIPVLPVVPHVTAVTVDAKPLLFTKTGDPSRNLTSLSFQDKDNVYVSQPIDLQGKPFCHSVRLDLDNLHPFVVFSVILSNTQGSDLVGTKGSTVLIRNGVTGTAARKRAGEKIVWNYHGKPLNDKNLTVAITVTNEQFTMAYRADGTGSDEYIVHGDTAISKLDVNTIGDASEGPFYLTIYLRRKSGEGGFINILNHSGKGYIHDTTAKEEQEQEQDRDIQLSSERVDEGWTVVDSPVFVKILLSAEGTSRLASLLDFYLLGKDWPVKRDATQLAHQTLLFKKDFPKLEYDELVSSVYMPLRDKPQSIIVTAIAADRHCICYITEPPADIDSEAYPRNKIFHITMRLRGKAPVYSNELAHRLTKKLTNGTKLEEHETYIVLPEKITLSDCILKFHF